MAGVLLLLFFVASAAHMARANFVVELLMVVEPQVLRNYETLGYGDSSNSTLEGDLDFLVNEVNKFFGSMSPKGLDVEIRLKESIFLTEELFDECKLINVNQLQGDLALAVMKEWVKDNDAFNEIGYDLAVFLTGYDLFVGDSGTAVVGYAPVSQVCNPVNNVVLVEFDGTQDTATTMAHEIAHNLGAHHDNPYTAGCNTADGWVMVPSKGPKDSNRWFFSKCSVEGVNSTLNALDQANSNCLRTTSAPPYTFNMADQMDRDILNPYKICNRKMKSLDTYVFSQSAVYNNLPAKGDIICQFLVCGLIGQSHGRYSTPSDGIVCDIGKRCDKGKCVTAPAECPTPPDTDPDCLFGDVRDGQNCSEVLAASSYPCYSDYTRSKCCATCKTKKTGVPNCEYGDKWTGCDAYAPDLVCPGYAEYCCYHCRNFRGKRSANPLVKLNVTPNEDVTKVKPETPVVVDDPNTSNKGPKLETVKMAYLAEKSDQWVKLSS